MSVLSSEFEVFGTVQGEVGGFFVVLTLSVNGISSVFHGFRRCFLQKGELETKFGF
jgi:hypothetical protein